MRMLPNKNGQPPADCNRSWQPLNFSNGNLGGNAGAAISGRRVTAQSIVKVVMASLLRL